MKADIKKEFINELISIANRHGFEYEQEKNQFEIFGCNVPTLADVRFLCEDYKVSEKKIMSNDFWQIITIKY